MSIYTTIQYIRYRLKAKTRHGVHSPFVYGFIEQVLLHKPIAYVAGQLHGDVALLPVRYRNLLGQINNYCAPHTIWIIPRDEANKFVKEKLPAIHADDVVLVPGIYTIPTHTEAWASLCANGQVRLSIDLYGIGLLFFKKEFKEKQHFVLKY